MKRRYAIITPANFIKSIIKGEGDVAELEQFYSNHFGLTVKVIPDASVAQVGWLYREDLNSFIRPQPHEGWVYNEELLEWEAPEPFPENGDAGTTWDEEEKRWKHIAEYTLEEYYYDRQYKGMSFEHTDGQTYHIQCREKDKTNVLGLLTDAMNFKQPGDLTYFTTYENVPVGVERDAFIAMTKEYFKYVSSLHFAFQNVKGILANDKTINVVTTFDQAFNQLINS
jgi:hypothetical protein